MKEIKKLGILFAVMAYFMLFAASAWAAEPKYTGSSTFGPKVTDGLTDEFVAKIREDPDIKKGKPLRLGSGIKDEDLTKLLPLADVLTGLEIESADGVTDLTPLSSLTNLTYLKVERLKGVATLAPLAPLFNMKKLHLRQVEYPDLTFLTGMNDLEELVFFMQPKTIEDITPLEGKVKLKKLNFYSAPITDISVLAGLEALEDLDLYMTKVEDLSPLAGLTKLKKLSLYSIPAKDMTPVGNLTGLQDIWIYATKFEDYSPLAKLVNLESLRAGLSKLDTLECVESMPKLKVVKMLREDILDFTPLAKCLNLTEIVLESVSGAIDLAALSGLEKLTALDVEGSKVKNPEAIIALPRLQRLDLQKTEGIADFSMFKDLPKLQYIYAKVDQFPKEQIEPYGKKAIIQK